MAQIINQKSNYLYKSEVKNIAQGLKWRFIGVAVLLLILFIISKIATHVSSYVFLIIIIIVILFLKPFNKLITQSYKKPEKIADQFYRGGKGENVILSVLKELSSDYNVVQDLNISNHGNIDFVVLGPSGIFAVEVKSHYGDIGFDGQSLTNNGKKFEKDFLKQAKREAVELNKYLKEVLNKDFFVQPMVVFSSKVAIHFGTKLLNGVYVVQKDWLNKLIMEGQSKLSADEIKIISEAIKTKT